MQLDMSKYKGDRLGQQNVGDLRRKNGVKFSGTMSPLDLAPTQEHIDDSRIENLAREFRTQGIKTPLSIDHTHEIGGKGNPISMIGDGHHRWAAALKAGLDSVPVEGYAYHGHSAPRGTEFDLGRGI